MPREDDLPQENASEKHIVEDLPNACLLMEGCFLLLLSQQDRVVIIVVGEDGRKGIQDYTLEISLKRTICSWGFIKIVLISNEERKKKKKETYRKYNLLSKKISNCWKEHWKKLKG